MPVSPNTRIVLVFENCQNVDRNWFINVLENVDMAHFIPLFCQNERFINVTFSYFADK